MNDKQTAGEPKSDLEIARLADMKPVIEIAAGLGIDEEHVHQFGHYKAKIKLEYLAGLNDRADGKLVLVTGITPTPAGEGKTTTSVGL